MKATLALTVLVTVLATPALAEPMRFTLSGNGGNCDGCEWLAAEGDIMADTADQLTAYLNELAKEFSADWRGTLVLNSRGGNLFGGMRLGEVIRARKMSTEVGKTTPDLETRHSFQGREIVFQKKEKGQCASACVFAFLGGVDRTAGDNDLGVHQFYNEAYLIDPGAKIFNSLDLSNQQLVSAVVLEYAVRMGVDPALISQASRVQPSDVHWLTGAEATAVKATWHSKQFEPWAIEPYGKGIVAFSKTRDGSQTATIFCRADHLPRLLLALAPNYDPPTYLDIWPQVQGASVFGQAVPRADMTLRVNNGKVLWELLVRNLDANRNLPEGSNLLSTADYAPHVAWGYFGAALATEAFQPMIRAALRNCL